MRTHKAELLLNISFYLFSSTSWRYTASAPPADFLFALTFLKRQTALARFLLPADEPAASKICAKSVVVNRSGATLNRFATADGGRCGNSNDALSVCGGINAKAAQKLSFVYKRISVSHMASSTSGGVGFHTIKELIVLTEPS